MTTINRTTRRALVVFPALAMVVSLGCAAATQADSPIDPVAKKTTTTVKKKSPVTTKAPKGNATRSALAVLASIPRMKERSQGYSRDLFKHWTDDDGDGCNTREEVLIAESLSTAQVDPYGCKVIEGDWFSEYDGITYTDPSGLDIDHVVALKEAWDSGAWAWSSAQRQKFANDLSDPRALIAVSASANRSKSDKDPSNWVPSRKEAVCAYITQWVAVKAQWNLSMDDSEWGRTRNLITQNCPTATVAPWGSSATASTPSTGAAVPGSTVAAPASSMPSPESSSLPDSVITVKPGAFCAPEGARGTSNGRSYVCSTTNASGVPYAGGRARWRQG